MQPPRISLSPSLSLTRDQHAGRLPSAGRLSPGRRALPKWLPPRRRGDTVRRERLHALLADSVEYDVTVIGAPAGFGKFTLAVDWCAESALPAAWLSLDRGDTDPLALIADLEDAEVLPDGDTVALADQRRSLIERLTPLRYFADPGGWDEARAEAPEWRGAYQTAYLAHFRRVARQATDTLGDLLPAITASDLLRTLNREGRNGQPIGQDALDRLRRAVAEIGAIPAAPDRDRARTGGVTLGRVPSAFADARLAAAAVLAAVEVQRRRAVV